MPSLCLAFISTERLDTDLKIFDEESLFSKVLRFCQTPLGASISLLKLFKDALAILSANFLLTLAGELCTQAQSLLQMGLHPSDILLGYEKASVKAHEIFENQVAYTVQDITDYDEVLRCMKSSVMSKQYGLEDTLGSLITSACLMSISQRTKKISVDNIRVQKILG